MLKILFMQIKLPMSSYYRMFGIFQGERRIDYLYNFFFKWAMVRCFSGVGYSKITYERALRAVK